MAAAGPGGRGRGQRSFHTHSPVGGPRLNPQAQVRAFQGKHLRGSWRAPRGPAPLSFRFSLGCFRDVLEEVGDIVLLGRRPHTLLCPVLTAASSASGCRFTVSHV